MIKKQLVIWVYIGDTVILLTIGIVKSTWKPRSQPTRDFKGMGFEDKRQQWRQASQKATKRMGQRWPSNSLWENHWKVELLSIIFLSWSLICLMCLTCLICLMIIGFLCWMCLFFLRLSIESDVLAAKVMVFLHRCRCWKSCSSAWMPSWCLGT